MWTLIFMSVVEQADGVAFKLRVGAEALGPKKVTTQLLHFLQGFEACQR